MLIREVETLESAGPFSFNGKVWFYDGKEIVPVTPEAELQDLKAKLEASERMGPGYAARIAAIKARIAELETE